MDGQAHPAEGAANGQTIDQLAAEITDIAIRVNVVSHRWLGLIAEFDRRQGWAAAGARSCADWLHWRCGLDLGAAREKVRVAHALERLPQISEAMASGELSYSKVRALTRVACPANEATLLAAARQATANHLETLVRQYRRTQEVAELTREARQFAKRQLLYSFDEDGALVLRARFTAEAGALILKALAAAMEEVPWEPQSAGVSAETSTSGAGHDVSAETHVDKVRGDVSAETSLGDANWSARRAEALALIAETYLKHGPAALNGGERHEIVLHVSAEMLSRNASNVGDASGTHC